MSQMEIKIALEDPESEAAHVCLQGYYRSMSQILGAPFDPGRSLDPDRDALRPPVGAFFVARAGETPLGCCALKGTGAQIGEIKRLWVDDRARGRGVARLLMTAAEAEARRLGMTALRLDTNRALAAAIAMYRRDGWREVPPFNEEPYAHHWFEKALDAPAQ